MLARLMPREIHADVNAGNSPVELLQGYLLFIKDFAWGGLKLIYERGDLNTFFT
jgi:hypothetical protein